jgi:hypothetical protein
LTTDKPATLFASDLFGLECWLFKGRRTNEFGSKPAAPNQLKGRSTTQHTTRCQAV